MRLILDTPTHTIAIPDTATAGAARVIETSAFLDRFPEDALENIADQKSAGQAFILRVQSSARINLDDDKVIAALNRLVAAGVIDAEQKAAILA